MIFFPNAKINIGLYVTSRREDGFHNLETVFFPVKLSDLLEVNPMPGKGECRFKNTGIPVDCDAGHNLIVKAYRMLAATYDLPSVQVHLHKMIPFGAGLGGGSSDAAYMLKALNYIFEMSLSDSVLEEQASCLGSDCAFFIRNQPVFASGRGNIFEDLSLDLSEYRIVLVKPRCGVSTKEAYAGIVPAPAEFDLRRISELPVTEWKEQIRNDFEQTVFARYPEIKSIKASLYDQGAVYASMTGSGSAVFGLFKRNRPIRLEYPGCFVWEEE